MKSFLGVLLVAFSLLANSATAAIYGSDDRRDINQVPWLRPLAVSIANAVPNNFLEKNSDGTYRILDVEKLGGSSTAFACMNERFAQQPTFGNCTGFLVGDRYVVTAGHCVVNTGIVDNDIASPYCAAFTWYFDYNLNIAGQTNHQKIPASRIYGCKRIIRAENIELPSPPRANYGRDFAIMELDRPVAKDMIPLTLKSDRSLIRNGQQVFTIGHPSGLPAKYSGPGPIISTENEFHFATLLDTLGGNSGGPVFNGKNEVVGILVSGHPIDYYKDRTGCNRANVCSADGKSCNENSKFQDLETSNSVQYIDAVLPYLVKERQRSKTQTSKERRFHSRRQFGH